MTEKNARRPFYETIVSLFSSVSRLEELALLAVLIKETKILNNHDNIAAGWYRLMKRMNVTDNLGVIADLLIQKEKAEQEAQDRVDEAMR